MNILHVGYKYDYNNVAYIFHLIMIKYDYNNVLPFMVKTKVIDKHFV